MKVKKSRKDKKRLLWQTLSESPFQNKEVIKKIKVKMKKNWQVVHPSKPPVIKKTNQSDDYLKKILYPFIYKIINIYYITIIKIWNIYIHLKK